MIYVQIKDGVVVNKIVLEDKTLIPVFSEGFDYLISVLNMTPEPEIGWTFSFGQLSAPPVPEDLPIDG